jgi:hypothetical protein
MYSVRRSFRIFFLIDCVDCVEMDEKYGISFVLLIHNYIYNKPLDIGLLSTLLLVNFIALLHDYFNRYL